MADGVFEALLPHAKIILAGAAGGFVRLFLRPANSTTQGLQLLAASASCAYFLQPLAMMVPGVHADHAAGVAFAMGLVGVSIALRILKMADKADFLEVLRALFGSKG